ncbi:hypothetical protein AJ79_06066 [Helicocarpus griseus UAMH5409]|uniref:Uncharacterized protein n=1 Tax=Helicocarpus griseus UAMH5409 TaxID=1447875 RepID=A0A2B7XHE0_9EURO|nr:hypothetical protein AJ79_06066 [Helicocarpus griseus UAMH5409]
MFNPATMPSNSPDVLFARTESFTLANGQQVLSSSVSPLLQQLEDACQTGSPGHVGEILRQITPLPSDIPMTGHVALQKCLSTAVTHQRRDVVRAMLQNGFLRPNVSEIGIKTAFQARDTSTLQIFIDCGWDVNETGEGMRPLLRHAVNDATLRSFLLAKGASPNVENNRGITPLETAAQSSPVEVVRELLDHGGDPSKDDSLIMAAESGRIDVAELLVQKGANVNALMKDLPLPYGQRTRMTALDAATSNNHLEMVKWLESHGATARNL